MHLFILTTFWLVDATRRYSYGTLTPPDASRRFPTLPDATLCYSTLLDASRPYPTLPRLSKCTYFNHVTLDFLEQRYFDLS
jgi:hypothetical protein